MKKVLLLLILFMPNCFALDITDAEWCRKNGGTVEFDFQYNINFNCITQDFKSTPYLRRIYNIVCIPFLSSITENKEPLFLKVVADIENQNKTIFDEYNFQITTDELVRYI